MLKFIFLTDTHGDLRDIETIEAAREFAAWLKPDFLIGGGDFWDFRCLRAGASDEDQNYSIEADLLAAEDTFDRFFGSYQSAHKVYLYGNHDLRRVERLLNSPRAALRDYAQRLDDEVRSVVNRFTDESRPYDKRAGIFNIGGFSFVHGYSHGIHAVRKHAISYGPCMFGHIHAFGTHVMEDIIQSQSHSIGCACLLDQSYNASHIGTLRQEHGFGYGFINPERGIFDIHHARKVDGEFFLPTEWNK